MKKLSFLILFFACFFCHFARGQSMIKQVNDSIFEVLKFYKNVDSLFTINDTTFLYRYFPKFEYECYHAIFIQKNKEKNWGYKLLTDFTMFRKNSSDLKWYNIAKSEIKSEFPNAYKKFNTYNLPENWLHLYRFKGKYYIYAPSDFGTAGKITIKNTEFVYWYMDGKYPCPYIDFQKIDNKTYSLLLFIGEKNQEKITIHIIDENTKMAVFEYNNGKSYELMIPVESAKYFDMIAHFSVDKQFEFDFDDIDFKELIKSSKNY